MVREHYHSIHTRWRKWRRRPWRDRYVLVEAMAWLGLARAAVLTLSFKRIVPYLGARMALAAVRNSLTSGG